MRGSIFIKIFLGFWLVSVAILGSWLLTSRYIDSLPPGEHSAPPKGPPERYVLSLIYGLQNAPVERLPDIIEQVREKHDIQLWLLDRSGTDITGQVVPPQAQAIAAELKGRKRRAFSRAEGHPLIAHKVHLAETGPSRMVIQFPPPRHRLLRSIAANYWLRVLIAILVSGLVCYALSRLVTNRLRDLGQASRQLAGGDLQTRISVRQRGGDETDELARDFNSMAEQLESRIEAQKRLLSDVSHELRSPLARVRAALALAEDAPEKRPEMLARIERETLRLEELIQQLLSSEKNNAPLDVHIDLVSLLEQLCKDANFEGEQNHKRVTLRAEIDEAIIASTGDLLHKSFENLIRNALHYTASHSEVRVSICRQDADYVIEVEDQGPGVKDAELERIFDEFYRVDDARSREDGGFGLGLAIARRAIDRHGGKLQARNSEKGLIVQARLPVTTA